MTLKVVQKELVPYVSEAASSCCARQQVTENGSITRKLAERMNQESTEVPC